MRNWVVMFVVDGETKVLDFDTYSLAEEFVKGLDNLIGIVTSSYFDYVRCVFEEKLS